MNNVRITATKLVERLMANRVSEGGHKAGCTCNFCKNKGSFGKKKKEDDQKEVDDDSSKESSDLSGAKPEKAY